MVGGTPDFATYAVTVRGTRLLVGDFVDAAISFLLIAAVVYVPSSYRRRG